MLFKKRLSIMALVVCCASASAWAEPSSGLAAFKHGRYEIARELLGKKTAKNAQEEFALGEMYAKGLGIPENPRKALRWYLRAAEKGSSDAENALGHMFQNGKLGSKNYREAAGWLKKAAANKNADAALQLGLMYQQGRGVEKSQEKSRKWIKQAAEHGSEQARRVQAQLDKKNSANK